MRKIILSIILLVVLVLIGAGCSEKKPLATPSEVVNIYMKCTQGKIPGCPSTDNPYELAKQQMTLEFRKQFNAPGFIPLSYCFQDGPKKVRIDSEKISNNLAKVRVSGMYTEWQEMWEFNLIIQENAWKIKTIICAPFPATYTNSKHEFTFEYPENWYLIDNPEFDTIFISSKKEEAPMGGVSLGARIEIFIIENSEKLELEEWIEWNKSQGGPEKEILKSEEIKVDGKKAVQEENADPSISVYLARDNYIIQINYTGRDPDYYIEEKSFNHLLNSFKY